MLRNRFEGDEAAAAARLVSPVRLLLKSGKSGPGKRQSQFPLFDEVTRSPLGNLQVAQSLTPFAADAHCSQVN